MLGAALLCFFFPQGSHSERTGGQKEAAAGKLTKDPFAVYRANHIPETSISMKILDFRGLGGVFQTWFRVRTCAMVQDA